MRLWVPDRKARIQLLTQLGSPGVRDDLEEMGWAERSKRLRRRRKDFDHRSACGIRTDMPHEINRALDLEMRRQRGCIRPLLDEDKLERVFVIDVDRMRDAAGFGPRAFDVLLARFQKGRQRVRFRNDAAEDDDHGDPFAGPSPDLNEVWPGASVNAMPVTATKVRKFALALPDASEAPHFDRAAFRTPRRIFATMPADGKTVNLMFDIELQEFWCENEPDAFAPVPGGWGKMGCTTCVLSKVDEAAFKSALNAAHARAMAPPKGKSRKR